MTDQDRQEIVRIFLRMLNMHVAAPRMGIVTSYDPEKGVKAKIMPESAFPDDPGQIPETGWMPIGHAMTGPDWGIYAPPSPGDQVMIVHQEHDHGSGVVMGRVNDETHFQPKVPSAEMWLVHKSGSCIKLTNDGKLLVNGHLEIDLTGPTINITANGDSPAINVSAPGDKGTITLKAKVVKIN